MNNDFLQRTKIVLGDDVDKLQCSSVAVFGLGGVGSAVVEGLARVGVGKLILCDNDVVNITNINRQIIATNSTIGRLKTDVCRERILDINPDCTVVTMPIFFDGTTEFDFDVDYVADCIDSVDSKLVLIDKAQRNGTPIISCMGTGNRKVADFCIDDISKTTGCPLARVMRRRLKDMGIANVKVLYSKNLPITNATNPIGSVSYVPPVAGYMIAGEIVRDIINKE